MNIPAMSVMEVKKMYELWAGSHLIRVRNIGMNAPASPESPILSTMEIKTTHATRMLCNKSAGTLIYTPNHNIVMPSGFGTRHAAAASISWAAECIAIAISESTRSVTLFQNGQMLQLLQK